jgi:hypothetical protein
MAFGAFGLGLVARTPPAGAAGVLSFVLQWTAGPLNDTGSPIAESSPVVATLDQGGPAAVVGDRSGWLYAYHLSNGSAVRGWPVDTGYPIDSSPSVAPGSGGTDDVFVGVGNAFAPVAGGYQGWGPAGTRLWMTGVVNPPGDTHPSSGVQASLTVADLQNSLDVVAGSLGQEMYALNTVNGAPLSGWPFFASDSSFSTPAVADLYGTGQREIVAGGDQTAGLAYGQWYPQGGHVRLLNSSGGLICDHRTDQTVDSSPAVGPFLAGGATGIVTGTGAYFPEASDTDRVIAFDVGCNPVWSTTLDGATTSSPALADVIGGGGTDVVEGTDTGTGGSAWVLDGVTGRVLWHTPVIARVIGSVVTADLTGGGWQDVLVPTIHGVEVLDGRSGQEVALLGSDLGFQSAPLVTDDPDGAVGVTIAGYNGDNRGVIEHWELPGSNGSTAVGAGSWPMFHHDPELSGTSGGPLPPVPSCWVPSAAEPGYHLVASDGGVFAFGQPFCGAIPPRRLAAPVVGMATAARTGGYWLVASDGGVFAFGGARYFGSTGSLRLNRPIVGMAATPDGGGYWLVASDGGVFAFGDAQFFGSTGSLRLNRPIVGMAATADGGGYRLVASDGGVFCFGDALYLGSAAQLPLVRPVVGMATDVATGGYWLVASDGGVFSFATPFFGSAGGLPLVSPIAAIETSSQGAGYRLVAGDGGVFAFGDAWFMGSVGGRPLGAPVVGAAGS